LRFARLKGAAPAEKNKGQKPHPLSRSFGTKDGPPNVNGLSQKRCYEFKGVPPAEFKGGPPARRVVHHRNLLVARVKITSYNHHCSAPFFRALVVYSYQVYSVKGADAVI
jgi:hypothetical protein